LLAIAAEPAEKPDARLLALDSHSPLTLVSQFVSLDHRRYRADAGAYSRKEALGVEYENNKVRNAPNHMERGGQRRT